MLENATTYALDTLQCVPVICVEIHVGHACRQATSGSIVGVMGISGEVHSKFVSGGAAGANVRSERAANDKLIAGAFRPPGEARWQSVEI